MNVGGVGQIVDDTVKELLNTLVLICGTHENGTESESDGFLTDDLLDEINRDCILKHCLHELFRVH